MGAQQSVNISCYVDRLTHSPGENVRGSVFVQVNENELSKFEGVTVTLAGVECICLPDTSEVIPGRRKITITQEIVQFENGKITKGEYEFPFSLALPYEAVSKPSDFNLNNKKPSHHRYTSSLPSLAHSETGDMSFDMSLNDSDDEFLANEDPTLLGPKQIMFQVKASLKRKPGVPITVDTDFRCKAHSAEEIMAQ